MRHQTRACIGVNDGLTQSLSASGGEEAGSRRFALRERTAEAHAALDQLVGRLDSLERYAGYLRGMIAFRAPVEEIFAECPVPGLRPNSLAPALRTDLADLGLAAPTAEVRPALHPHSTSASGRLGILYVLEGASLGARLLYRDARALGLSERYGARHLAQQAADTVSWRAFLALLGRSPAFDLDRAASAALATFNLAHRALEAAR
jgi:heme oxygenase